MFDYDKLWQDYKIRGDENARDQLITKYVYLAKYAVDRMNIVPSGGVGYDDLISHAIIGLIDAIEKYEHDRGIKFESYALTRIKGATIDAIRTMDWMPRSVRRDEGILREAYAELENRFKRPATDGEVAEYLGISLEELDKKLSLVGQSALMSLDEMVEAMGESAASPLANLATDEDPALNVQANETRRLLAEAVGNLPEREKLVITLYYYEELTLKEIAKVLGVTESRVSQMHTRALLRLSGKLMVDRELFSLAA